MAEYYTRAVISTDRHGKETRFESMKEAAAAVGLRHSSQIAMACNSGYRCAGRHWRYAEKRRRDPSVHVGDHVEYRLSNFADQDRTERKTCPGIVVYVHPAERYHTVDFTLPDGKTVRRSFPGVTRQC